MRGAMDWHAPVPRDNVSISVVVLHIQRGPVLLSTCLSRLPDTCVTASVDACAGTKIT